MTPLSPPANTELASRLPPSFVIPRYEGASLCNLPATVGRLLGVDEGWMSAPLEASTSLASTDTERVVLLLLDGVSWSRLKQKIAADETGFGALLEDRAFTYIPITSVAPSTTSVATTVVLGNGAGPAETGMLGYTFLLPSYGVVANMLFWYPEGKAKQVHGELETWGLSPKAFLPTPSIAEVLGRAGVTSRVLMPAAYSRSPLSRMRPRGAEIDGYINMTDMWFKLGGWLKETARQRAYVYVYYPDFDTLSHRDGSAAPLWDEQWQTFAIQFKRFMKNLDAEQRAKTTLLITADHGHIDTPLKNRSLRQEHPDLFEMCTLIPGGEARHLYLYLKDGCKGEALAYSQEHLADSFFAVDAQEALELGLYGPTERIHPETSRRIGDAVLLAKGPNYFWDARVERVLLGKHGGLEADEMLVPFIGLSLD